MNAPERREAIWNCLRSSRSPISAGALARQFSVSRQIIVGDIALLRAGGEQIEATPRGYLLRREDSGIIRTIAVCHTAGQTEEELNICVDNGCTVLDVIVEHPLYGQLTGQLHLASRYDVRRFMERSQETAPLSLLTDGVHLHTLQCPDEGAYERVCQALGREGILLE